MTEEKDSSVEIPGNALAYFDAMGYDEAALSHKINHAKMVLEHIAGFGEIPIEMSSAMENMNMDRSMVARWLNRLDDNIEVISVDDVDEEKLILLYGDIYQLLFTEIIQTLGKYDTYVSPKKFILEYANRIKSAGPDTVSIIANLLEVKELGDRRKGLYVILVKNDRPELPPIFPPVYVYDRKGQTVVCVNQGEIEEDGGMMTEFFENEKLPSTIIGFVGLVAVITGAIMWWRKKKNGDAK